MESLLPPGLVASGPLVIGATGGSGTRVIARILEHAGLFVGGDLNESHDATRFGDYSDRWINTYVASGETLPAHVEEAMLRDLRAELAAHTQPIVSTPRAWGWKEPRSIYLLPLFHRALPTLRFVHVVRDGRDMALSTNQNQLRKHASVTPVPSDWSPPERSIALWSWVNVRAMAYAAEALGERYVRVRFEDLCQDPVGEARRLLRFAGLETDAAFAREAVSPPRSLGRWRHEHGDVVAALERAGQDGLRAFGYELAIAPSTSREDP